MEKKHFKTFPFFSVNNHLSPSLSALERKISMRQSREELIKRGVLKEIFDKGKRSSFHSVKLTSHIVLWPDLTLS